uniref:(California timema) hypothetical protein n=1 Tax=Timema californicum TaxID=61474 RepID=A0A7R9PB25_TIMCA|nr:unnamed protein product [Timema californicum]
MPGERVNRLGADNAFIHRDWKKIAEYNTAQCINWIFNPPNVSWGGVNTVFCDCISVINSRPLEYISEDSADLILLTPAMFLHDRGITNILMQGGAKLIHIPTQTQGGDAGNARIGRHSAIDTQIKERSIEYDENMERLWSCL